MSIVVNSNKNGKKVCLHGTFVSKFVDGYEVKVPSLRAIISREEWQIMPIILFSFAFFNKNVCSLLSSNILLTRDCLN